MDPMPYIYAAGILGTFAGAATTAAWYRAKLRASEKLTWAAAERFYTRRALDHVTR